MAIFHPTNAVVSTRLPYIRRTATSWRYFREASREFSGRKCHDTQMLLLFSIRGFGITCVVTDSWHWSISKLLRLFTISSFRNHWHNFLFLPSILFERFTAVRGIFSAWRCISLAFLVACGKNRRRRLTCHMRDVEQINSGSTR